MNRHGIIPYKEFEAEDGIQNRTKEPEGGGQGEGEDRIWKFPEGG